MMKWAEYTLVEAGFHTTVLPITAGAVHRLPPMDVKLNGETANTKPSRGRVSMRFHVPGALTGCSARIRSAKCTLKRRKSMSSHAASISAWWAVLLWPSMVAPLTMGR